MKTKLMFLLIVASSLLSACGAVPKVSDSPQSETVNITISGAFAIYPLMVRWAEVYQEINTGVRIDVSAGGAGKGMADVLSGMVDIGMVSREVKAEEQEQGAYWIAIAKDAVFPAANSANPALEALQKKGLTRQQFERIFLPVESLTWGQIVGDDSITQPINIFTRSDACGAAEVWAGYLGARQEDLQGIGVFGDPGILEAVIQDPYGIGYNNLNYLFDASTGLPVSGAIVIPIDVNENGQIDPQENLTDKSSAIQAVASGQYPSPPARLLNLVTKGKPAGAVQAFLQWVLTDGQRYLDEVGYIPMTEDQILAEQAKLQ